MNDVPDDIKRCERCGNYISTILKNMLGIKSGLDLELEHLMKLVFRKYQEGRPIEQKCNGDTSNKRYLDKI